MKKTTYILIALFFAGLLLGIGGAYCIIFDRSQGFIPNVKIEGEIDRLTLADFSAIELNSSGKQRWRQEIDFRVQYSDSIESSAVLRQSGLAEYLDVKVEDETLYVNLHGRDTVVNGVDTVLMRYLNAEVPVTVLTRKPIKYVGGNLWVHNVSMVDFRVDSINAQCVADRMILENSSIESFLYTGYHTVLKLESSYIGDARFVNSEEFPDISTDETSEISKMIFEAKNRSYWDANIPNGNIGELIFVPGGENSSISFRARRYFKMSFDK